MGDIDTIPTAMTSRSVPWHGGGNVTGRWQTTDEALIAGGLDWEVVKEPVERKGVRVPNKNFTIKRKKDGSEKVLGIVADPFPVLQNDEGFAFVDTLLAGTDDKAYVETAGELRRGKVVFMSVKLPEQITIANSDLLDLYLNFRMGHDGTMSVITEITPIRIECTNTMILSSQLAKHRWAIPHTGKMHDRLVQVEQAFKNITAYTEQLVWMGDTLVATKVSDEELTRFLMDALPNRPTTEDRISEIVNLFNTSNTIPTQFRGTAWGALNATTEFFEHGRDTRSPEAMFQNVTGGEIARVRQGLVDAFLPQR
jgi:phage/plasmid-like protein (TIGR03299 family)